MPTGQAITRSGARGDGIYVTGELGAPAYALDVLHEQASATDLVDLALAQARLEQPTPRVWRLDKACAAWRAACWI